MPKYRNTVYIYFMWIGQESIVSIVTNLSMARARLLCWVAGPTLERYRTFLNNMKYIWALRSRDFRRPHLRPIGYSGWQCHRSDWPPANHFVSVHRTAGVFDRPRPAIPRYTSSHITKRAFGAALWLAPCRHVLFEFIYIYIYVYIYCIGSFRNGRRTRSSAGQQSHTVAKMIAPHSTAQYIVLYII